MSLKKRLKRFFLLWLTNKQAEEIKPKEIKKIVIFRYDRIGDMIVTTPLFRELKLALPWVKIEVLASYDNKDVIRFNPYVDKVIINSKRNFFSDFFYLRHLRSQTVDVCIDLDHSIIWHSLLRLKFIKPRLALSIYKYEKYDTQLKELKIFSKTTAKNELASFSQKWLEVTNLFGFRAKSSKYDIFLSSAIENRGSYFLKKYRDNFKIIINLSGSFPEKRIEDKNFINLSKVLTNFRPDIQLVLLSTPRNFSKYSNLINSLQDDRIILAYKSETILEVAALIKFADFVITPDTSIVHVASAFNKPVLSIHENNKKSYNLWRPTSEIHEVVYAKSSYGILDIEFDEVIAKSKQIVNSLH